MAKARTRRRAKKMTLPISVIGGFFPLAHQMHLGYQVEGLTGAGKQFVFSMTGYHQDTGTFNPHYMWNGLFPIVVGGLIHWGANRLGINRTLAQSRIPLLRV